jgi:uncharacterized membrane protein
MNTDFEKLLRTGLKANSIYTLLCGLILLATGHLLAAPLGLAGPLILWIIGAGFLLFGAVLGRAARQSPIRLAEAGILTFMDVGYVIASLLLVIGWPEALSSLGKLAVIDVATIVAILVVTQFLGLRRLSARETKTA